MSSSYQRSDELINTDLSVFSSDLYALVVELFILKVLFVVRKAQTWSGGEGADIFSCIYIQLPPIETAWIY